MSLFCHEANSDKKTLHHWQPSMFVGVLFRHGLKRISEVAEKRPRGSRAEKGRGCIVGPTARTNWVLAIDVDFTASPQ